MEVAFKSKGTQLLKSQKYMQAIDKYTEALNIMNQKINRNEIKSQQQMFQLIQNIKLPCLKNISLCYMKLKQYADCIITCDLILDIDSECQKTYYRKAFCLIELEQFKDADAALAHAQTINQQSKQIKLLRQKWKQRRQKAHLKSEEKQGTKDQEIKNINKGFFAIIINIIMYWIMLPLRWSQYVLSFFKKTTKSLYSQCLDAIKSKIITPIFNLLSSLFNKANEVFLLAKQNSVLKVNQLTKRFIGPINKIVKKYLSFNIPFYKIFSGENDQPPTKQTIKTRYEGN